jgi:hypothetical protein
MHRNRTAALLTGVLLACGISILAVPARAAVNVQSPTADTYVQDGQTTPFGTSPTLKVDGSPITESYVRFPVSAVPASATLCVFTVTASSSTTPINVRPTDNSWSEGTTTYSTKPPLGAPVVTGPSSWAANSWLAYDVTTLIKTTGDNSFAVVTSSGTSKTLSSREGANPPQLLLGDSTTPPACGASSPTPTATATPTTPPPTTPPPTTDPSSATIAVAGDVACSTTDSGYSGGDGTSTKCRQRHTADVIAAMNPKRLWALGDLQYQDGKLSQFQTAYDSSWGRFKAITDPVVGNHEYKTAGATGYSSYFGSSGGSAGKFYYSKDITVGTSKWHVVVINSECTDPTLNGGVGCAVGSPQHTWLKNDLEANKATTCTAVLTHKARWSSSMYTSDIQPLVDLMGTYKVELLLAGHAHSYERFAPQTPTGASSSTGIREFVIGTGGIGSIAFGTIKPNSQVRSSGPFGVQQLTLKVGGYDWAFKPDSASSFTDTGSGTCS